MRDFNFFDPYIKVQAKPKSRMFLMIILLAFALALVLFYQILLINKANDLENDIAEIDQYLLSADTLSKSSEVDRKQAEFETLQMAYTNLVAVTMEIEMSSSIDDMLFEQINAQLPSGTFLTDVSNTAQLLTIKGYSMEYSNIAQFAFNLHNNGTLDSILIPNITENNGSYMFTITASVGAEVSYEN